MDSKATSVDPSTQASGVGLWERRTLVGCALLRAKSLEEMLWKITCDKRGGGLLTQKTKTLIVERPRIYGATQQKGDQNEIMQVGVVAGAWAGAIDYEDLLMPFPADWKGQLPKEVMVVRIQRCLSEAEREMVEIYFRDMKIPESLKHNVWDGIGVGAWRLGRLST